MYKNYENRVKDFVLDMTNPHSIVERKDITEKITNTRLEVMNELFSTNPDKKKPLVFRGYTSEADRIKDTIKKNRYLYYLPDYDKIKKDKKKLKELKRIKNLKDSSSPTKIKNLKALSLGKNIIITKDKTNKDKIKKNLTNLSSRNKLNILIDSENNENYLLSQPTMRYKPRTDLERVYDTLNEYNYDQKSKNIIERQLKSINLYDCKKSGNLSKSLEKKEKINRINNSRHLVAKSERNVKKKKKYDLYKTKNIIYYNPKDNEYKPWQRRDDLNNEAYGLLSSYHYKTHFKAAEEIAESNYRNKKNKNNKNSVFLLPNLLPKFYQPKPLKTENDIKVEEDPFKFDEDDSSSELSEDYEEFDKNYNPIIPKSKTISDPGIMKMLTKIAFKKNKSGFDYFDKNDEDEDDDKNILKNKNKKGNKNYNEDNSVFIGDKLYYKNTQFDKITNEILGLCKIYSTKSKFNNTINKSKGGKTMITQGMTVREFERKYGLQE